ncbi:MAG: chromosome segregation protein SMC [Candidatus Omnitrophica bacterium]|nr:chromosome segregation protein SMC [Candidatus Omnitrophota bacterium]
MYFKKLELFGFKSFVEKTSLMFEPGVTAIVGPNGTGKSNIADAIKWVLGEQSAKSMRGSKMEDVIFNGTETHPAVNMTEVSLILSNEDKHLPIDYDEITITRRLYRSGESEYLLNKTPVRLKDINEMLMGTGIGTESYSILEQGRIDAILSSKPEDRRVVFEEASGITKFKKKKDEALRKLQQTEDNLLRANDIIVEVTRQLNSIQRQVNKARRYQEQFEQLKNLEIQSVYRQYNILEAEKKDLQQEQNTFNAESLKLAQEVENLNSEFNSLRTTLSQVESDYSQLNNKTISFTTQIEKNNHSIALNRERIDEFNQRIENLTADIEKSGKKVSELEEQTKQLKSRLENFQKEKEEKENLLRQKESELARIEMQIKEAKGCIEVKKAEAVKLLSEQTQLKNDLVKLAANIHNLSVRLIRLRQEKDKTAGELEEVNEKLKVKANEVDQMKRSVAEKESTQNRLRSEQEQVSLDLKKLEGNIQDLKHALVAKQSQLDMLDKLSKNYEGFSDTVKAFMLKKDELTGLGGGVHDALANLIEVKPGYEVCVETALNEYLQAIIVDTREVALELKDFLATSGIGKVKFIALDSVNTQKITSKNEYNLPKISNFISCNERYRKIIDYLLKDTYLADSLKDLRAIGTDERFLTKEGEMSTCLEVQSRPSVEQGMGIISQKAQIRTLKEECRNIAEDITGFCGEERSKREKLKNTELELSQITSVLNDEKIVLANRDSEHANVEAFKKKLDEELSIINLEIEESSLDEQELKVKESENKIRLDEINEQTQLSEEAMTQAQELIKINIQAREELLVVITEMRTEFSLLDQQEVALKDNFSMANDNLEQARRNQEDYRLQKEQLNERIGELLLQVETMQTAMTTLEEQKKQAEENLSQISGRRKEVLSRFENTQNQIRQNENTINEVKNNIRDYEVKGVELNYKINSLTSNIQQSYKVNLASLIMELDENIDWNAQNEQIDVLKEKIERMGSVNLAAVEEEEELKERANFLNSQKEDLISAKSSLMQAIHKINRTTKDLFLDTFEKSKVAFKEYFRLLFNGGDAQLVLSEEGDVLESGINIVVRPPGKKLQNITLLSGGEKTLTAIALLFALFKIKPTPFCILDEMDAPLDEANVERFTRVLQEFLKTSQFIIITHNKKTISVADVMYGVTMELPGISKLVSVKFSEYKPTSEQKLAEVVQS